MLIRPSLQKLLEVESIRRERRQSALQVVEAALAAVEPGAAVLNALHFEEATGLLTVAARTYNLNHYRRIVVVGAGKAGTPMAAALYALLGQRITAGAVTVKYGYGLTAGQTSGPIVIQEAAHPILDEAGIKGAQHIVKLLQNLTPQDLVIAVISGGGSALLELPVANISLADMQVLTDALLRVGATINQINAVRKHLSQVKGGNLARLAAPAQVISLIVSDVVGSPLDVIASGPTVPDNSTFQTAWQTLETFGLTIPGLVPAAILEYLQRGRQNQIPDTPKSTDPIFERVQNLVVADNRVAALAAATMARQLGFQPLLLSTFVEGEAREVARVLAGTVKEVLSYNQPIARPACLLCGGETTVTIQGDGKGGRNQELGLALALALEGYADFLAVPLATDGSDGPTDAAGVIVEGDTLIRAQTSGVEALDYLSRNDSYHFFEKLGDLLITGPTNTNVNDLTMLFCF